MNQIIPKVKYLLKRLKWPTSPINIEFEIDGNFFQFLKRSLGFKFIPIAWEPNPPQMIQECFECEGT